MAKEENIIKKQNSTVEDIITSISNTNLGILNSKIARQTKEFSEIKKIENEKELRLLDLKDDVNNNIKKSGISSDSFFNMAFDNITDKDYYTTSLDNAASREDRFEASKKLDIENKKEQAIGNYVNYYKDWAATYVNELEGVDKNSPGGVFTGTNKSIEGGKFNDFSKKIYKNYAIKNALIGAQLNREGTNLLSPVEFYQKEDGTVMGKLSGFKDFDIIEEISKPPALIQDFNKLLGERWKNGGYTNDRNEIKQQFLNNDAMVETKSKTKDGVTVLTKSYPINSATSARWLQEVETVFQGQLKSISNEGDFNNMQATYMAIAGDLDRNKDGALSASELKYNKKAKSLGEIKPLEYKNSNFELTDDSAQRLRDVYLNNAYRDFMGNGIVEKSEVISEPKEFDAKKYIEDFRNKNK